MLPSHTRLTLLAEIILVLSFLLLSAYVHGVNMFHYPYYEDDEGTYMSQAWSLVTQGKLAPYTYIYDHAPAGWMMIGLWTRLTGGFFTFGFSVNSGRVLMLLIQLFSAFLLYLITKKLTGNILISLLAVLIFSLSPLGVYYHRRVLLDNIMVFWILLSLFLLLRFPSLIGLLAVSAFSAGMGIVTKETAIVFLPAYIYTLLLLRKSPRLRPVFVWFIIALLPVFLYLFYALSRHQLFPDSTSGAAASVSLIGTWIDQFKRPGGSIFNPHSLFWQSAAVWFQNDPIIISLGFLSTMANFILGIRNRSNRITAVFSLLYLLFLFKGGLVLEFYIIPLLPFFALNIALMLWAVFCYFEDIVSFFSLYLTTFIVSSAVLAFDLFFFGSHSKMNYNIFTTDQTGAQINAVNWILTQKQPLVFYAIDNYGYVDLHARHDQHFKYAEYYWKIERDPGISAGVLNNNWRYISYLVMTPQMKTDLAFNNFPLLTAAYKNSVLIKRFNSPGWGVDIWLVKPDQ